jgi:uncharacterized sporulation protein YeaH/YhbH (DUF444 family)
MTHIIIDRTTGNKNKSSPNREKFIKRSSEAMKRAVKDYIVNDASIDSIADGKNKKVKVKSKNLNEPMIYNSPSENDYEVVAPGNKDFDVGDSIEKQKSSGGKGKGRKGSDSGESEDDFYFTLTHDEFVDIFFGDLELPDLVKKSLKESPEYEIKRAGFSTDGPPSRLDLRKTLMTSMKRNFAASGMIMSKIGEIKKKLEDEVNQEIIDELNDELEKLYIQLNTIPFMRDIDLRYKRVEEVPNPSTKAVMFCILDVSASMTSWHKEMAKRFFMLLYLFLTKQYKKVDLVFIKHHHEAFEVDEQDFFYSRDSGGTIVSSAMKLVSEIIEERYDKNHYNMYICQCSDGDDYGSSDEVNTLYDLIANKLIPVIQYFAYVEINAFPDDIRYSDLMKMYKQFRSENKQVRDKLNIRSVVHQNDIFSVFRSLFTKKGRKNEQEV